MRSHGFVPSGHAPGSSLPGAALFRDQAASLERPLGTRALPGQADSVNAKRIGLLIDSLIGGGAERVVLNLASAFRQLGHEVHVIVVRNEIQHVLPDDISIHVLSEPDEHSGSKFVDKLILAWRMRQLVA